MTGLNGNLLERLLDGSDFGVIVIDPERRIVLWNDWIAGTSGIPADQALDHIIEDLFPELRNTRVTTAIHNALTNGLASLLTPTLNRVLFPLRGRNTEQTMEQVVVVKALTTDGLPNHCFIQITDITEMAAREKMLRQQARAMEALAENYRLSEVRTRAIVDNALDAILTFDDAGRVVTYNPAAERIFGFPTNHVLGRSIDGLLDWREVSVPDDIETSVGSWQYLAETQSIHECTGHRVDGATIFLELSLGAMELDGNPVFVATARDISLRKQAEARVQYLAHFDSLTDLPNRVLFRERLNQAFVQAKRTDMAFALLMLDLDRFKSINDTLGHHIGDLLLKAAGERIAASVRESDTVARLGGDEFAVILTNLVSAQGAGSVAETIVAKIAEPFALDGNDVRTSVSIGISLFGDAGGDADALLKNADLALYRSKAKGRNTYHFFVPQMDAMVQAHKEMEHELRSAIEHDQLNLHYQPLVDTRTGGIVGAEALLRWDHGDHGHMEAREFVPLIDDSDLAFRLRNWVTGQALSALGRWREGGHGTIRVSINMSATEFLDEGLPATFDAILADAGMDARALQIEITEDTLLMAMDRLPEQIRSLQERGIRLAIDDFGTGASSLDYLRRHPVNQIKIDPSFLRKVTETSTGAALFAAMIELGHGLGAEVAAKGVESQEQSAFVRRIGVEEMQGFHLSRPLPADAFAELLDGGPLDAPIKEGTP